MAKKKEITEKPTSAPAPAGNLTPETVPAEKPSTAKTKGGKRMLIVEDEKPLAHALELKMGHEGYDTHVCLTGSDGLNEAVSGKYELILLDLIMPEMDGFTVLEEMKKKNVKTKVIVLSNLGQEEDKQRALSLGAVQYFVKANTPISEIVQAVKKVL